MANINNANTVNNTTVITTSPTITGLTPSIFKEAKIVRDEQREPVGISLVLPLQKRLPKLPFEMRSVRFDLRKKFRKDLKEAVIKRMQHCEARLKQATTLLVIDSPNPQEDTSFRDITFLYGESPSIGHFDRWSYAIMQAYIACWPTDPNPGAPWTWFQVLEQAWDGDRSYIDKLKEKRYIPEDQIVKAMLSYLDLRSYDLTGSGWEFED